MGYRFILMAFLGVQWLVAQDIQGTLSNEDKQPIEGAYIHNLRTDGHTHSNEVGRFKLDGNRLGDTLRIGALGFKKKDHVLTEGDFGNSISFVLQEHSFQLEEVVIRPKLNSLNIIPAIDLRTAPVRSSQEILQKVPGLIIGQHAGGGKAEQLFLRGFDIDHGTDIAISVDGMPVNMVSHAHGQGYADLHFVIPETLDNIDFGKGPYYANKGNFETAAYVDFRTKEHLDRSTLRAEYGDFGWNRTLGMFNLLHRESEKAYVATELTRFDGPFNSPQNFSRINVFGKYTAKMGELGSFSMTASHFTSTWDASGQIPQRAVDNGSISRFGAIDDTEGGTTQRSNVNIELQKVLDKNTFVKANAFYSNYKFQLFSNFTFFLEDPENGDQIEQRENRDIFGLNASLNKEIEWGNTDLLLQLGTGFRTDGIADNQLSHTLNRKVILDRIQWGDVNETNVFGYANMELNFHKWTLAPGLRVDNFDFGYVDALQQQYSNLSVNKTTVSPKFNILYNHGPQLQLFLKSGIGFHSNDTRVVVAQNGEKILPAAYGSDLGAIWKPSPKILFNTAAWYLYLEQEFVYVGDAGIVEPSGKTERYGLDLGLRYQLVDWLFLNTDATLTHARSIDAAKGQDHIPLTPDLTLVGGIDMVGAGRFSGGIRYRYLDNRPANEDGSLVAKGYFVTDMNINYTVTSAISMGLSVENLFDTEWNETQFATTSQLANETIPVEEIHFTPGTPFFLKGSFSYSF